MEDDYKLVDAALERLASRLAFLAKEAREEARRLDGVDVETSLKLGEALGLTIAHEIVVRERYARMRAAIDQGQVIE